MVPYCRALFGAAALAVALPGAPGPVAAAPVRPQAAATAQKKPGGLLGNLAAVDAKSGLLTITLADGTTAKATLSGTTEYVRVQPGKTSLDGAEHITLAALESGDRVWARGTEKDASGALVATQVVLMSAKAIVARNEQERTDWRARGTFGEVKAVDAAKGELTVESQRGGAVVVTVGPSATVRRLKPGSMDLEGAQPINLADIAVGSRVAVRGERSADGTHIAAESVLTGDFPRPAGGRVVAVDAAKGEIDVTSRDGHAMKIFVGDKTSFRKLTPPPQGAGRPEGNGVGPTVGSGEARGGTMWPKRDKGEQPGGGAPAAAGGDAPGAGSRPEGGRGPGGFGFGDRAELERRTEPIALADIAVGDFVFALTEPGSSADSARAAVVVKMIVPPGGFQRRGQGGGMGGDPMGGAGQGGSGTPEMP